MKKSSSAKQRGGGKSNVLELPYSSDIDSAIASAIAMAQANLRFHKKGDLVKFDFNGVTVSVNAKSDPKLIRRDWERALNGYIPKRVGPNPKPVLTKKENASDARIAKEQDRERQKRQTKYREEAIAKRKALEVKLAKAPEIELADKKGWQEWWQASTKDGYSHGVAVYAERWARLMQIKMATGEKLPAIAEPTSREADTDGITGFMYGCAVSTLARFWKHGEKLRRWHNLKTHKSQGAKANKAGAVLNPAVLIITV